MEKLEKFSAAENPSKQSADVESKEERREEKMETKDRSFWSRYNSQVLEIFRDPSKETKEKSEEIAKMRLIYLADLLKNPFPSPPGERGWKFNYYTHDIQSDRLYEVLKEGLIPPQQYNMGKKQTKSQVKAAAKFRKITDREKINTLHRESDGSLYLYKNSIRGPFWGSIVLFLDPHLLHEQCPEFYSNQKAYYDPSTEMGLRYPKRVSPKGILGLFFNPLQDSKLHFWPDELKEVIEKQLSGQKEGEKEGEKDDLSEYRSTWEEKQIGRLIDFFQKNPKSAVPIFSSRLRVVWPTI